MKEITPNSVFDIPYNFTGIVNFENGVKQQYKNGKLHRLDGPAVDANDVKIWYCHGKKHRLDGPAFISERFEEWYYHGKLHRDDGPAIVCIDKFVKWYRYGKRHRLDGPAIESLTTDVDQEYWINGIIYSKKEFDKKVQLIPHIKQKREEYKHLTDGQWHDYLNILVLE